MEDTAGHADAYDGEEAGLLAEPHDQEADDAAGERVEGGKGAGEEEACQGDADQVDRGGIAGVQPVEHHERDQIGQTQLDARDTGIEGHQRFHIGKDQGERGQQTGCGDAAGGRRGICRAIRPGG